LPTAAGSKMEFELASVKQNKTDPSPSDQPYSSFPMDAGGMYRSNGGHLVARDWPFARYLQFANKSLRCA
jgi:hypothetical protein